MMEKGTILIVDDNKGVLASLELLLETEFKCPIRVQLVKGSVFYLREQISRISEVIRFLGRRIGKNRDRKLDFNHLRNAINATW